MVDVTLLGPGRLDAADMLAWNRRGYRMGGRLLCGHPGAVQCIPELFHSRCVPRFWIESRYSCDKKSRVS